MCRSTPGPAARARARWLSAGVHQSAASAWWPGTTKAMRFWILDPSLLKFILYSPNFDLAVPSGSHLHALCNSYTLSGESRGRQLLLPRGLCPRLEQGEREAPE